ncbi:MAG TPA: UDP-3-O-(3-hydroxymyristoyl)glucosamine N-acyltransferase [bacterium]|nr:UDP-3-O-(3-hydroxymyristoyl)glucosamine N-acyltransferase [bacterium]HOL48508.1 UDP-3-O-(3-hydroxymyristoyl)glucosamine N-acyltransferase [bacterium]HPQ20005.1 UDP-3-O-(3-hydroxymyristoyl)glucosamine N-acyltransferase [bacterium]
MKNSFTVKEIASKINGKIKGKEDYIITGINNFENANSEEITFAENDYILKKAIELNAGVIITNKEIETEKTLIIVENPKLGFAICLELFLTEPIPEPAISDKAYIGSNVKIGKDVYIGPFAVIEKNVEIADKVKIYPDVYIGENSKIGENTKIYSGVKIYYNTIIGKDCIIHSGAVIGADGFGFFPYKNTIKKLYQIGNVIIKDNIEIGANTTIDRATMGSTIIENNVKIDDQVHIGHNCKIGENSIIVAQVGIAGSCIIGKNVTLGGQTGIAPYTKIGDNVMAAAKTGISSDIKSNSIVSGFPARDHNEEKKIKAAISKLPEQIKKLRSLYESVIRISHRLEKIEQYLNLKIWGNK